MTLIYIYKWEKREINLNNKYASAQGYKIKLDKVEGKYGDYTFAISVLKDGGGSNSFVLFRDSEYFVIKDYDMAVEITNDYVFNSYSDRVALNVYYN